MMMSNVRVVVAGSLAALSLAPLPAPFALPSIAQESPSPARPQALWSGFSSPVGMDFDSAGNLYVAEWSAGRVSRIDPQGNRSTFADELSGPSGLTIGPDGSIYVASYSRDAIYRFTPDGARSVHVTGLATPAGLGFDRAGRLIIANRRTNQILAVTETRQLVAVIDGLNIPVGAVQTPDGGHVVSNLGGGVTILRPDGTRIEAGAAFGSPGPGIAMTKEGRVFVVDYGGTTVREILPDGRNRAIAEGLRSPVGLTLAPDGRSLLTAAWGDGTIYRISIPD